MSYTVCRICAHYSYNHSYVYADELCRKKQRRRPHAVRTADFFHSHFCVLNQANCMLSRKFMSQIKATQRLASPEICWAIQPKIQIKNHRPSVHTLRHHFTWCSIFLQEEDQKVQCEERLKCEICVKWFATPQSLNEHIKFKHSVRTMVPQHTTPTVIQL